MLDVQQQKQKCFFFFKIRGCFEGGAKEPGNQRESGTPSGLQDQAPVEDDGRRDDGDSSQYRHNGQNHGVSTETPGPVHVPLLQAVPRHDGEGEGHDVDGPHGAEARQNGQQQIVPGFGSVLAFRAGAGLAAQRGSGRTSGHGPRPAATPTAGGAGLSRGGRAEDGHHAVTALCVVIGDGQVIHVLPPLGVCGRGL